MQASSAQSEHLVASQNNVQNSSFSNLAYSLYQYLARITPAVLQHVSRTAYHTPATIWNAATTSYTYANDTISALTWTGASQRLEDLPDQEKVLSLVGDMSVWLERLLNGTPQGESEKAWHRLIELLDNDDHLHCLNHIIHGVATGHNMDQYLAMLPERIADKVQQNISLLRECRLISSANYLINMFSEPSQAAWAKIVPDAISRAIINDFREKCFPDGRIDLTYFLAQPPRASAGSQSMRQVSIGQQQNSANAASRTTSTSLSSPSVESNSTQSVSEVGFIDLTNDDQAVDEIAKNLWHITSELLEAARTERPDPEKLNAPQTPIIPVTPDQRRDAIKSVLKDHVEIFEVILAQEDFNGSLAKVLDKAKLPDAVRNFLDHKVDGIITDNAALFRTLQTVTRALGSLTNTKSKEQLIDELPDNEIDQISNEMNHMLNNIDPYTDEGLGFFKEFADDLVSSIKIKVVREVAERLTQNYFPSMKGSIEFQRDIAMAVLNEGRDAKIGDQITAIAQAAGIGFQKGMQLFGDGIQNPVVKEHLSKLKQDVDSMPTEKVKNIVEAEFKALRSLGHNSIKIARDENGEMLISDEPLKSATISQVHSAIVTYPGEDGKPVTEKVAIKVKRDGAQARFDAEREGLIQALRQDSGSADVDTASIESTVNDLMAGFAGELQFVSAGQGTNLPNEYDNSRIAKRLFNATDHSTGVSLKAAGSIAATNHMIIQHWAPGQSIDSHWKDLESRQTACDSVQLNQKGEHSYQQDLDLLSDKLEFLETSKSALKLELSNWVRSFVTGGRVDNTVIRYLDSDRHDGNAHLEIDKEKGIKLMTMLDFGAGIKVSNAEKSAFLDLVAGLATKNTKACYKALSVLVPELQESSDPAVRVRQERALKGLEDVVKVSDEAVIKNTFNIEAPDIRVTRMLESRTPKTLKVLAKGHAGFWGRFLPKRFKERNQAAKMNQVLNENGIQANTRMRGKLTKHLSEPVKPAMNLWTPKSIASDRYNDVFVISTFERVADVLGKEGFPAPKLIILLNRGSKFLSDKVKTNNERIEETKRRVKTFNKSALTKKDLKQKYNTLKAKANSLNGTNIGNVYFSALLGQGGGLAGKVLGQVGDWVNNNLRKAQGSSS